MNIAYFRLVVAVCFVLSVTTPAPSQDPDRARREMFENKIRPVLVEHCYSCHSAKKTRGGLALDTRDGLRKGGVSGPSIVAGKANESLLIVSLRHTDPDLKMPQKGPKLSDDVIADFIRWVNAGAFDPRDLTTTAKRDGDWWSLRPLRRPEIPKIDGPDAGWVKTSIDAFILASLREKKLTHSKAAEPRVLIRRMSLDLLGLPPTPEDVERFCEDYAAAAKKQEAVERLADRLLASPHYGERWARHWLDVVHFGESNGFGMDRPRMNAWPYRDYVINAFNSDKPYARFVQEQIAADILFPNEAASISALGFAAAGPFNQSALVEQVDGTDCRKIALNLDRDDIATNVATTFLSMTVHCARCHEHKFDPIDQRDYYRFQAVFAGVGRAERPVNSSTQWQNRKNMLDKGGDPFSAEERKGLAVAQVAWEESVRPVEVDWQVLTKLEAKSEAGTEFTQMADGSYLCGGKRPDKDTYTFTAKLPAKGLAAVKLEVLTDSSLPQQGPGRQDNGNLTLSEFRVRIAPASEPNKGIEVPLVNPQADFNQDGWEIARAIDSRKETGWAIYPEVGKSHFATFEFKSPIAQDGDSLVTFQLEQLHGTGHLIGRLRLSVANRAPPLGKTPLPATIAADLRIPLQQRTPEQADRIYKHFVRLHIDGQIAALPQSPKVWAIAADFPPIRNYKAPKEPVPIHVLKRGDFKQPLDPVGPGGLDCVKTLKAEFADINPKAEGERRAALARWITDPENMLTWRSIANRIWHYHFGKGIVDSPNDLGRMGSPPTHPELLDWLAVELRDNGGSLKKLHRLIVTSAVYNQVSADDPARAKIDADNRYLWRMDRPRLDAETLRDSLLAITGKLDRKMGGPSVMQFQFSDPNKEVSPRIDYETFDPDNPVSYRRSVYRFLFRNVNDPLLDTFDAVDPSLSVGKRNATITPLQALALMNNRFVLRQCEHLAARLEKEAADTPAQIDQAFRLILGRLPREGEATLMVEYAQRHGLANACRVLLNCNDFLFVP